MASRGQALTITYTAWDTSANAGKTGDSGNHTLRWVKDGTSAAPSNSPAEVDATNAPGVYKITLTTAECTCWIGTLCGKSGTANVSIMPLTVAFEQLPTAAPDAAGGLPVSDAGGLDMDSLYTYAVSSAAWGSINSGIVFRGSVTAADADSFTIGGLAGQGAGAFIDANTPWYAYVFRDAGGLGAAPQGEQLEVTGYTSATGRFTPNDFTEKIAAGDNVIIMSGRIAAVPDILEDTGTTIPALIAAVPTAVLDQAVTNNPSAKEYTLRFVICMMMNSNLVDNSGFLTVYDTTDTEIVQLPVTTSSSAKPVTGVS